MEQSADYEEKEDGLRLRKNVPLLEGEESSSSSTTTDEEDNDDVKPLVSRLFESTKELTDCMPTDFPASAKRMVSCINTILLCIIRFEMIDFFFSLFK